MPILATFEGYSLSCTHCIRIQINVLYTTKDALLGASPLGGLE